MENPKPWSIKKSQPQTPKITPKDQNPGRKPRKSHQKTKTLAANPKNHTKKPKPQTLKIIPKNQNPKPYQIVPKPTKSYQKTKTLNPTKSYQKHYQKQKMKQNLSFSSKIMIIWDIPAFNIPAFG